MKVLNSHPPNYDQIASSFGIKGRPGIIYTYGDTIYNPSGIEISPDLFEHEKVHMGQQGRSPDVWWDRYCEDQEFRLNQELAAYRVQYKYVTQLYGRSERRKVLAHISNALAGPMYGYLMSPARARSLILEGVN